MAYYTIANGIVAGICFGFGLIFLFTGLRRRDNRRLYLLFSLFALTYGGTLFNGIRFHNAGTADSYISIVRGDTVFVVLVFIALIWYVAEYTRVKPRLFIWGLTAVFIATGIAQIFRTNLLYDQILGLNTVMMPWGEEVSYLESNDSIWSFLFLAAQLAVLGYMIYACVRQYLRGERSEALILSIGTIWFVAALAAELSGGAGVIPPIFYGEFGFLGFAIAMSLTMANDIIKTEEELADYRLNLEKLVSQRTAELEVTQTKLLQQTQEQATIEERSRLARDLHDAVTQTIFSAALISEALPAVWERNADEGRRNLAKLRQLVRGALAELRTLLFELRPDSLAAADLQILLQQLSDAFTGRTRIPVSVESDGAADLPADVKVALYRIAQEAFNNIEKHAQADRVIATLQQETDQVTLVIGDNGRGFDPEQQLAGHMGHQIMRERAQNVGGVVEITSNVGEGSIVQFSWPDSDWPAGENNPDIAEVKNKIEGVHE